LAQLSAKLAFEKSPLAYVAMNQYDPAPLSVAWQARAQSVGRRMALRREEK
jgi:hypothetical protein